MSGLRCWPGCLAEIVRSQAGNVGRRVVVLAEATRLPKDCAHLRAHGLVWEVQPLQPLGEVMSSMFVWADRSITFDQARREDMCLAYFPDSWLRPIVPPPDAETETVDEVLESARGVPAEV